MSKKKLLLWGDGPMVTTGFGTVMKHVAKALHGTGKYDIDIVAVNYWGQPFDHNEFPYRVWPGAIERQGPLRTGFGDPFGKVNFGLRYWTKEYDGVFILNDVNVLTERLDVLKAGPNGDRNLPEAPLVYYFPVDSYYLHPGWLQGVDYVDHPVTYNHFTIELMEKMGLPAAQRSRVIPHGTDVESFHPVEDREQVLKFRKEVMGVDEDTVLFVQVARNQVRKANGDLILAYKEFRDKNPNIKSKLYFHMHPEDNGPHQWGAVHALGMTPGEDVTFKDDHNPGRGVPVESMNLLYNAADVFCTATLGEGWGLPVTEAMAARTPVIAPNNTSLTEILGLHLDDESKVRGWPVRCGEGPQGMVQVDGTGFRPRITVAHMAATMAHVAKLVLEARKGDEPEELTTRLDAASAYAKEIAWPEVGKQWVEVFDEVLA